MRTEDEVRDRAKIILGFDNTEPDIQQGTGQITTFNRLGFKGVNDKPDGWYFPKNKSEIAIVLETKSEAEDLQLSKWVDELFKNVSIAKKKYRRIIGILYNGKDIRVFKTAPKIPFTEIENVAPTLQHKSYYLSLFTEDKINKQKIYALTKQINDCLHIQFGIKNLYHRMIFTACALVAKRYGAMLVKGMNFTLMKNSILSTIAKSIEKDRKQNLKLDLLIEVYAEIKMNNETNQESLDSFIEWITEISDSVNSDNWNGEDVMGIFFNEFNRYKKKSESGQIFTPDHITSFMYRLIDVNKDDGILDATCGSGAFLVKAMCNMTKEVGGSRSKEAETIKSSQLFGIEFDREIFALACANMLIHKDGKTNLEQLDARTSEAADWIKSKRITKVLMNPPYERKYGCMKIVKNVLDSVPKGTKCAFILPDKKLEKDYKDKKYGNKVLKDHTLSTIIKLPENLFFGIGLTTSIFVFETGKAQKGKNIIGYYIEEDGLETVKNKGRQDIKNKWQEIENYWITAIHDGVDEKYNTRQIINPSKHLSYQMPEKAFAVYEEDFVKTMVDYEMFKREIDLKDFKERLARKILYVSDVDSKDEVISIIVEKGGLE
jgi:type I restriction-modification system DNA methylase subunit